MLAVELVVVVIEVVNVVEVVLVMMGIAVGVVEAVLDVVLVAGCTISVSPMLDGGKH